VHNKRSVADMFSKGEKMKRNSKNLPDFTIVDVCITEDYKEGQIDIDWITVSAGFGHLSFCNKDGKIVCNNEGMSRDFVKQVLIKLVDKAIMAE